MCSLACQYDVSNCSAFRFDADLEPPCQLGSLADNVTLVEGGIKVWADMSGFSVSKVYFFATIGESVSVAERIDGTGIVDIDLPVQVATDTDQSIVHQFWQGGILSCFGVIIATGQPSKDCYHAPLGSSNWTALPPTLDGHTYGSILPLEDGRLFVAGGSRGNNTMCLKFERL